MKLSSAKNKVNKALKTYLWAKEKGLPRTGFYPDREYYAVLEKLDYGDEEKFTAWYRKVIAPQHVIGD